MHFASMEKTIKLSRALALMLELTQQGRYFSFTYVTRNKKSKESRFKTVERAVTRRKKTACENDRFKLYYNDLDNPKTDAEECWECLIVFFNGYKVVI